MEQYKILVVEDEVIVGMDLLKKLVKLGYQTGETVIRYGEEVSEAIENSRPDLVLMDIQLKGEMDGTSAAVIVQNKFGIPVVFLTSFSDADTLEKAKLSAPNGYLKKPVRLDDLKVNLEMALYKAKMEKLLKQKVEELEKALKDVKTLEGFIPICTKCKNIRDDKGFWNRIEAYIQERSTAQFTHSLCPNCAIELYGNEDWYNEE